MLCFDPFARTWTFVPTRGNLPTPRAAHSMVLLGDDAYVFGGRDCHGRNNDLYRLNLVSLAWEGPLQTAVDPLMQPCGR